MGAYRTLKAWQHAKVLAVECAKAARRFPSYEQDGLASQLRRSAYGAALNIAEGCARRTSRDYRRFLETARSSLSEVEAIVEIAKELGYIEPSSLARIEARHEEAAKTLYGLLRAVERRIAAAH